MAAYAALLSLMDLVEQIQHHPHAPLSLDQKQAKSLIEKVRFLQGFLDDFHSRGFSQVIQAWESRITDVAHAASDVIESQILHVCGLKKRRWIPNFRKLTIYYRENADEGLTSSTDYCLDNLGCLQNLESLKIIYDFKIKISFIEGIRLYRLILLYSLKKLTLQGFKLDSELMSTMIGGSLPFLQVLKLIWITFIGDEWNLVEGQFSRLKYLLLFDCRNSKWWKNADSTHFPCLERLHIACTYSLVEFPRGMGDIPTLQFIDLEDVIDSVVVSAKRMLEKLEEQLGEVEGLLIRVAAPEQERELLKSLSSDRFQIRFF